MNTTFHPLVKQTKIELERLDRNPLNGREQWYQFKGKFLPIHVEPRLRPRALRFMNDFLLLVEANYHTIEFQYNRCHIEMYGQLTEINLRQKYYRKRIKDKSGYSSDTYVKSNDLEFQIGYSYRKGWKDSKIKKLEDYLPLIFETIRKDSKDMSDLRIKQRIKELESIRLKEIGAKEADIIALENAKYQELLLNVDNHKKAEEIRSYVRKLRTMTEKEQLELGIDESYMLWALWKANDLDSTILR